MRLKSEMWVKAYLRQWFSRGNYGAILRIGAPEAGAVYVVINRLDGTANIFGPAPGPAYDEKGDRRWALATPAAIPAADVPAFVSKQARVDPDIWVIELEDREGTAGIECADDE